MMIHHLVTDVYKLKISGSRVPGTICAVSTLEFIYERYGYEVLDRTLRLSLSTWEGEDLSLSASILKTVALLISVFGNNLDEESFRERVGKYTAKAISRTARDRRPGIYGYAEAMLILYNGKNKKKLSMRKVLWANGKRTGAPPPDYETN